MGRFHNRSTNSL